MLELEKVIENIMTLPLDKKAHLAEILLRDIDAGKTESAEISGKRTFGEYIGKIEMSDEFNAPLPDEF
ncbi:MAG: hypothetical protein B6245_06345 [Desulfobacteraceae bacterium 4572_88]|nr:MAG: hypothetical protein B6245_06345 [Desulfobacteraceae bacterium 4572_88]